VILGDLAHRAVAIAVPVVAVLLLIVLHMTRVIGVKSMLRRRRPRRERS